MPNLLQPNLGQVLLFDFIIGPGSGQLLIYITETRSCDILVLTCLLPHWCLYASCNLVTIDNRSDQVSQLEHKWTFDGHQLGVVSVDINPAGTGKLT